MKDVIVGVICKKEYNYIKEFVEYHLNLGFDRIIIGDNNDNNGEAYDELLKVYIESGQVKIINLRGLSMQQKKFYNDIIDNEDYEWCAFIDVDEFITFGPDSKYDNIKDFLLNTDASVKAYKLNWQDYGDNDIIYYEKDKGVVERFKEPLPKDVKMSYTFSENSHTKSILRKGINGHYFNNPHTIETKEPYYTPSGKKVNNSPFNFDIEWEVLFIRHYYTKTIEEWTTCKLNRGFADTPTPKEQTYGFDIFFKLNEVTKEKMEFIRKYYERER